MLFRSGGTANGALAIDSSDGGRLYFRYAGAWHYIAQTAGFQIPKEEVAGLQTGDLLLPYVDKYLEDGAIHGLYKKLDLASLLASQSALSFPGDTTFLGSVTFNSDAGGYLTIPEGESEATYAFQTPYATTPVVTVSPVDSVISPSAYILTGVNPESFTILLDSSASATLRFSWIATSVAP